MIVRFSQSTNPEIQGFAAELKKVFSEFEGIKTQVAETTEDFETVNKQLFNLAGTGLAAERFTHEFARLVSGANASLGRLKQQFELISTRVKPSDVVPKMNKEI